MSKIKICGISRLQDADALNTALPDYAGFGVARSRRPVSPETAKQLRERLDSRIQTVGVFVNAETDVVAQICGSGVIGFVQLHGDEDAAYIAQLKQSICVPVIKAVRVQSARQI